MLRRPPPGKLRKKGREIMTDAQIADRAEALAMLTEKAREGSTSAMIALERALRAEKKDRDPLDDELDRILGK
jgi:hypothetical protein